MTAPSSEEPTRPVIAARVRVAFVDESQSNQTKDPHTYILAAAICHHDAATAARAVMETLKLKGQQKIHWRDESSGRRQKIATTIAAATELSHLVVVRDGRPDERPERRRRLCLETMFYELDQLEVATVTFESRGRADNARDRDMLDALRARQAISARLRIDHLPGPRDALLWVPDAVCGAVSQDRTGDDTYLRTIQAGVDVTVIALTPRR